MRLIRYRLGAALFVLLSLAHSHLIATVLLGRGSEPAVIFAGHLICLAISLTAAIACWSARTWAWLPVAGYGVAGALLILSIAPALQLPAEDRPGLWFAAGALLILASTGAWRLRQAPRA